MPHRLRPTASAPLRPGTGTTGAGARSGSRLPTPVARRAAIVGGIGGMAAAPVFIAAVLGGASQRPGFDQWSTFVSELGEAGSTSAAFTNGAFVAVGVCLFALAGGLALRFAQLRDIGALLAVPALAFVVLAGSPCSSGCPIALVDVEATASDAVHNLAASAGLAALALAALLMAERAPAHFGHRRYRQVSRAAGVAIAGLSAVFAASVLVRVPVAIAVSERLVLLTGLCWNTLTGFSLWRDRRGSRS